MRLSRKSAKKHHKTGSNYRTTGTERDCDSDRRNVAADYAEHLAFGHCRFNTCKVDGSTTTLASEVAHGTCDSHSVLERDATSTGSFALAEEWLYRESHVHSRQA